MGIDLEAEYRDFVTLQGLKGQIDVAKVCADFGMNEEELFDFVAKRVAQLEELNPSIVQSVGEYLGTALLFGYWLRGVRGDWGGTEGAPE